MNFFVKTIGVIILCLGKLKKTYRIVQFDNLWPSTIDGDRNVEGWENEILNIKWGIWWEIALLKFNVVI